MKWSIRPKSIALNFLVCVISSFATLALLKYGATIGDNSSHSNNRRDLNIKKCEQGDVGWCYYQGLSEEESGNREEAMRLFKLACNKDDWESCGALGALEHNAGNLVEGRRLFKLACNHTVGLGCLNLGNLEEESGNREEAMRLFKVACDDKVFAGCENLRQLIEKEKEANSK